MAHFINIADLRDPDDPEGRSYREVNAARSHAIPIGSLVEHEDGTRAFVVFHGRDCDQTPLYGISLKADDTVQIRPGFANPSWRHGIAEHSLTVIRLPGRLPPEI